MALDSEEAEEVKKKNEQYQEVCMCMTIVNMVELYLWVQLMVL